MPGAPFDRLDRPVTLVTGKGGVGKSTTATGLALSIADRGESVHLLSTDPAHSLSDILGDAEDEAAAGDAGADAAADTDAGTAAPPDGPRRSHCSDRLVVEELDARAYAEAYLGRLAPGLAGLIDRGTYLDADAAASLLDASLPGLDEIGAALRLTELVDGGGRLVVDTAPTGHTLRLLDTPRTIRGWVHVFEAMATKAATVAGALVGRSVRFDVESELDALLDRMDRFEAAVRSADVLVVTGAGEVVRTETDRLIAALRDRGLAVTVTVGLDRPGVRADILLPVHHDLVGCAALRRWWDGIEAAPRAEPGGRPEGTVGSPPSGSETVAAGSAAARAPTGRGSREAPSVRAVGRARALPRELDRELVVVAGKGGVGKTTCAAAIALASGAGPVTLLGTDPTGSLADVVGHAPPGLEVRQLDAENELQRFRLLYQREVESAFAALGLDRAARLDRAVVESLWELAPPGIDEVMAVSRLAADERVAGRLVLDTAPTGHFLRLIGMPELALDWTRRIMRILLQYQATGALDAPAEALLRFARRFRQLRDRLADPSRTAIVLVTLDERVTHAETLRLTRRLRDLGLAPAALVVNRSDGSRPSTPRLDGVPTFTAPVTAEPIGADALRAFMGAWERLS